jgi:S-adenosylmethionine decarboxylase
MKPPAYRPAGLHLIADLYGVSEDKLNQPQLIENLLRQSAQAAGAQILHSRFHSFGSGMGVTGVVLLAESHISIHTWPECRFAAADIFMCGDARPQRALEVIKLALQPVTCDEKTIVRGLTTVTST